MRLKKQKEKWAEESNPYDDVHDYEEFGVWPAAWLSGFEFARQRILEALEKDYEWDREEIESIGEKEVRKK